MNRKLYLLAVVLFVSFVSLTSCSETEAVDKYANWSERNVEYLDFIASQVTEDLKVFTREEVKEDEEEKVGKIKETLKAGDLRRIQDWRHFGDDSFKSINDYVYIRVNEVGNGTITPHYTDSVYVYYRGSLINDVIFDSSYGSKSAKDTITLFPGKPNGADGDVYQHIVYVPDTDILTPAKFKLGTLVVGWVTAMQQMHVGDCWTLYIPSNLGYGTAGSGDIPGGSLLIFDVTLGKILDPAGEVIDAIKQKELN